MCSVKKIRASGNTSDTDEADYYEASKMEASPLGVASLFARVSLMRENCIPPLRMYCL